MPKLVFETPKPTKLQRQFTLREEVTHRFGKSGFEKDGQRIQYQVLVQLASIPNKKSKVRKQARRTLNLYGRWNRK